MYFYYLKLNLMIHFSDSQFFAEGFKMYYKDKIKNGGGLLLYVNENLPIKIINTYKFKKKI